jgi:hypothetical protein
MKIIRNKTTINLTDVEREAIEIVKKLANDLSYNLSNDELAHFHFNDIMKESWGDDNDHIEVSINDLFYLLDNFQKNIDEFNS